MLLFIISKVCLSWFLNILFLYVYINNILNTVFFSSSYPLSLAECENKNVKR